MVLADMGLDQEARGTAGRRKPAQRAGRGEHQIADATHVDHRAVGADMVKDAGQLGDHRATRRAFARQAFIVPA